MSSREPAAVLAERFFGESDARAPVQRELA